MNENEYDAVAYTDGSYFNSIFTYGLLLFDNVNNKKYKLYKKFDDVSWSSMHNVAGEIMGVIAAIQTCEQLQLKKILIIHDYQGLSKWANGEWKRNKKETKLYKNFIDNARNSKNMKIDFKWVKSHSNNKNNDIADELAKKAYNAKTSKVLI